MGGLAIQRFVDAQKEVYPKLRADRIHYDDLSKILPKSDAHDDSIVSALLQHLVSKSLIHDYPPTFDMGTTRLAAWHAAGGSEKLLDRFEVTSDAIGAMAHKSDFGDIDIGVYFATTDTKQIIKELHDKKIGGYHFFARKVVDIHLGVIIDDERMVQIDLNNVASNPPGWQLTHFSSFLDLHERLKGVYQTSMVRVLVHRYPVPVVLGNKEYTAFAQKCAKDGFTFAQKRCSLTPDGFIYAVHEWERPSKRIPDKMTCRKFKFAEPVMKVDSKCDKLMQALLVEYARHYLGDDYVEQNHEKLLTVGKKEIFHLTAFLEFIAKTCPELVQAFADDLYHDIDNYVSRSTPDASMRTAAKLRIRSLLRRHRGNSTRNKKI
jgi:hypothetical protein